MNVSAPPSPLATLCLASFLRLCPVSPGCETGLAVPAAELAAPQPAAVCAAVPGAAAEQAGAAGQGAAHARAAGLCTTQLPGLNRGAGLGHKGRQQGLPAAVGVGVPCFGAIKIGIEGSMGCTSVCYGHKHPLSRHAPSCVAWLLRLGWLHLRATLTSPPAARCLCRPWWWRCWCCSPLCPSQGAGQALLVQARRILT